MQFQLYEYRNNCKISTWLRIKEIITPDGGGGGGFQQRGSQVIEDNAAGECDEIENEDLGSKVKTQKSWRYPIRWLTRTPCYWFTDPLIKDLTVLGPILS